MSSLIQIALSVGTVLLVIVVLAIAIERGMYRRAQKKDRTTDGNEPD